MASIPIARFHKFGWNEEHKQNVKIASCSSSSILLIGDSIAKGLRRAYVTQSNYFRPLNFGIGGDRTPACSLSNRKWGSPTKYQSGCHTLWH